MGFRLVVMAAPVVEVLEKLANLGLGSKVAMEPYKIRKIAIA
jgi:hypothetical protein